MEHEERLKAALADRYQIEREIGSGGMATVYLAQDLRHDRKVAVKVLKPELAAVVGTDRFLAAIRTTATLSHPDILPLFDSGEADGFLFHVMPYVEGESLRQKLERDGQLSVEEAVRIASQRAGLLDILRRARNRCLIPPLWFLGKGLFVGLLCCLAPAALVGQSDDPLRVGLIRYKTDELVRESYTPFVEYIAEQLGTTAELTILPLLYDPGAEIDDAAMTAGDELAYKLVQGDFDLGIFKPFLYLKAREDFPELEVFATHLIEGDPTYLGAIFVRHDSGIETLNDLRGRTVVFTKETSTSGFRYPRGVLREYEIDIDEDLAAYSFSNDHAESVRMVLDGVVDGTAIDRSAFDELPAEDRELLRELEQYEVPYQAYVLSPTMDAERRDLIKPIMFNAHRTAENRARLFNNGLGIERWVVRADLDYNSLRRYLEIMRVKPSLRVTVETMPNAEAWLAQRGDLLDALRDDLVADLARTRRFLEVSEAGAGAEHAVTLILSMTDDRLTCRTEVDEQRIDDSFECTHMLERGLPRRTAQSVLAWLPMEDRLQYNGERWFLTLGRNDGIEPDNRFDVESSTGSVRVLDEGAVEEVTRLNTYFRDDSLFERGMTVTVTHVADLEPIQTASDSRVSRFLSNVDNRWGVAGLVLAFLSVAGGTYLGRRKRRIFSRMLKESNELVLNLLEGKSQVDKLLLEQGEKIARLLGTGKISENQFLILDHRLEEIRGLVKRLFTDRSLQVPGVEKGVQEIIRDGKITEREYRRLLDLVHGAERLERRRGTDRAEDRPAPHRPDN